jgi:signal transduction histidine kinase
VTARTPDSGLESIEKRYDLLLRLAPYLLLVVPLIPYALSQSPTAGAIGITIGVAGAAGAWISGIALYPDWMRGPWRKGIFFIGLIAFVVVLTARSPWFAFFTWIGFMYAFRFLTGAWRWVVCVPIALAFGAAQGGGFHRLTPSTVAIWVLITCVDLVLIGVFVLMGQKTAEQNEARKGMIAELAEANQRLEQIMAENTGLQAQLLIQAREAGAGDERQRMAREIHDTLAQGLTGIITQLEAAQQTASEPERERRIDNAKRLARDSLAEARRSVQALRPQALEDSKLPDALAEEVARWTATSGVPAEVRTTGDPQALHPEVEVTLLRVAQEALANVAKHAAAAHVWVTLSYMEDVVTLDVRDDGAGFDQPEHTPSGGGFGLIAMRQRVNRLAGQLEVESEPGAGTVVSASLPAIPLGPPPRAARAAEPPRAARAAEPPRAARAAEPPRAARAAEPPQAARAAEHPPQAAMAEECP